MLIKVTSLMLVVAMLFLQLSNALNPICKQPAEVGPCRARIPRWYYDTKVNRCRSFGYGGCHGNSNNFRTLRECQKACSDK